MSRASLLVALAVVIASAGCRSVDSLAADLRSAKPSVREEAARELWERGSASAPALDALVGALEDEQRQVRMYAAMALGEVGPSAAKAAPHLIRLLDDRDSEGDFLFSDRYQAALALAQLGPAGHEAVPALVAILRDEPDETLLCSGAGLALQRMGRPAIPALADLLAAPSDQLGWAVTTLAGFDKELWPAIVDSLRPVVVSPDKYTGTRALTVVGRYAFDGSAEARRVVESAARTAQPEVQQFAKKLLAQL